MNPKCAWCPAFALGTAVWQGDGIRHPSCGCEGHGTDFKTASTTGSDQP